MTYIRDLLGEGRTLSLEFFPPKTDEAMRSLEKALGELESLRPSFVSVTYGAGGTTRDRTRDLVVELCRTRPYPAMAHLTCVGHTRAELEELIGDYAANGVTNILALGGDPPTDGSDPAGDYAYASELVSLVRSLGEFSVGVAAFPELHPRSERTSDDRRYLAAKLDEADFGITQFFFDPVPFFHMREDLARLGCTKPVIAGIMPVVNPTSIRRFADLNRARVPPALWARLEAAEGEDRVELAADHAAGLIEELLAEGVDGIHLYTLNRSDAALKIAERVDELVPAGAPTAT